jgi:hypothetical protein
MRVACLLADLTGLQALREDDQDKTGHAQEAGLEVRPHHQTRCRTHDATKNFDSAEWRVGASAGALKAESREAAIEAEYPTESTVFVCLLTPNGESD